MSSAPRSPRPAHGHSQFKAYFLMRYEGAGGRREWIWNSRDAITPFTVRAKDDPAIEMRHTNWHLDRYEPRYVPAVGTRVFVDLTEELARPMALAHVERGWDRPEYPMAQHPAFQTLGKEGTVEYFVTQWVAEWGGHAPSVLVVTPALHAQFAARAAQGQRAAERVAESEAERAALREAELRNIRRGFFGDT